MPQPLGTRTVGDVITWVTEQFGDIASVQLSTPKLIRWINMAMLEICTRDPKAYQGKWNQDSVVNQNEYPYPTGLLHVAMVRYGDRVMQKIAFETVQIRAESAFKGEVGPPIYWSHFADSFFLWPVPDAVETITVFGAAKAPDVVNEADLLSLSDRFFPRICEYVYACAQELDEDYESAAAKRSQFEDMMKLGQNSTDAMQGALFPQMGDPDYDQPFYSS